MTWADNGTMKFAGGQVQHGFGYRNAGGSASGIVVGGGTGTPVTDVVYPSIYFTS
jgi:hypothetical protein